MKHIKPLYWAGSSKKDLKMMPDKIRNNFGFALFLAQQGQKNDRTKPVKGYDDMKHTTKKNIIAVFSGILILFLSLSCMDFLFTKFNWLGSAEALEKVIKSDFNDMEALDNYLKAMSKTALIIFPVSMMIAAVVSSIIAHSREYLFGFISILPPLVFLGIADQKMIWLVSLIPSFLGVAAVKFVKKKRRMRVVT